MNDQKIIIEKLERSIKICRLHIERLDFALQSISDICPLSVEKYESLSQKDIQAIDQFIYRFIKLQDEIGSKTFRLLLLALKEDIEDKPFLDVLTRLEKYRIIESDETWLLFRELRNELTHEYPEMILDNINGINNLYSNISGIKIIFDNVLKISLKYKLI